MVTTAIFDRVKELMSVNEPIIFDKVKDTEYGLAQLTNGKYELFFSGKLTDEEKAKIMVFLNQAIEEHTIPNSNEKVFHFRKALDFLKSKLGLK